MVQKYIPLGIKIILSVLFGVSAIAKLADAQAFADSLNSYQILPKSLVPLFSYYVPVMELGLAISFLVPRSDKVASVLTIVVLVVFQLALGSLVIRGIDIDCACFGQLAMSPEFALVRNFVILGMCSLLLYMNFKNAKLQNRNTV